MTPFVDVAFLILSFFMLATKFKPPEPAPITTPHSVSADQLKESNNVIVSFDSSGRVFMTVNTEKPADEVIKDKVIQKINETRRLGLTNAEMVNYRKNTTVGVPFAQLKSLLNLSTDQRNNMHQSGIPADSTNNELAEWIGAAKATFYDYDPNMRVDYMIKGDNNAKYPQFNGVIEAMRKNDQYSYKLVTDPKSVPAGTVLYQERNKPK